MCLYAGFHYSRLPEGGTHVYNTWAADPGHGMLDVLGLANNLVNILYIFCHAHRALW